MNLEEYIKGLAPELQERARSCSSVQELLALAKQEKIPVPDEVLAAIAGGTDAEPDKCFEPKCPKCGSKNTKCTSVKRDYNKTYYNYVCNSCGYEFVVETGC